MVNIRLCSILMMLIYWGGSIHTVKDNAEAQVFATKEIGLELNADKTKYIVMIRE